MYLLFAGMTFYPRGGWEDYRGRFDTLLAAMDAFDPDGIDDWAHVVDTDIGSPVICAKWSSGNYYHEIPGWQFV